MGIIRGVFSSHFKPKKKRKKTFSKQKGMWQFFKKTLSNKQEIQFSFIS